MHVSAPALSIPLYTAHAERPLTILSEELGYANYGFKMPIHKGLTAGSVAIDGAPVVPVGGWAMRAGLAGKLSGSIRDLRLTLD